MHHLRIRRSAGALAAWLLLSSASSAWSAEEDVEAAKGMQRDIDESAQQTQQRIDQLSEQAQAMLREYRAARDETENLRIYNDQLASQVDSQKQEVASLRKQLTEIDRTQQEFVPMMLEALDALERFVERDLPFRRDERRARLKELREMMGRADVTTAEKYRQLMETFQEEMKYGRTIGTYRGTLELDGEDRSVRFLRVGRVALLYQTLDGQRTGRWDPDADTWQALGDRYRAAVEKGLRIAAEQAPPDLLRAPLNVPEDR